MLPSASVTVVVSSMPLSVKAMTAKRDRVYVAERIQDFRRQNALSLPQDIKLLSDLVEAQENQDIRSLGTRIVTEMRVFARNVDNL